jgi:ubiquinone/menaquinone biosynthesis C-methylase UbiE
VAGRFSPGIIDYDSVSVRYQSGRALSESTAKTWSAVVAPFVRGSTQARILDLGAGTGRFASLLASSLDAAVIGVEPSTGMLAVAAQYAKPRDVAYVAGVAERIPLGGSTCDLAWLSHVWHHIRDHQACAHDLRRVVRPGGYVLVRGTFGDCLDGFPTLFQFWPAARSICEQLPTVGETVRVFETCGFSLQDHRRIEQETAADLGEFAQRTRSRADSALMLIPDSEFDEGQTAIERAAAAESLPVPVVELIELLVFRRSPGAS